MPWTLDIHVIDVGAGDSTLIIAEDLAAGHHTSMLIDAGLSEMARFVHTKVTTHLPALGTILISHYDEDHSDGVVNLLLADNLWHVCDAIAQVALPAVPAAGTPREQVIARVAARAAAAAAGAWGPNANQATAPGNAAAAGVPAGAADAVAAQFGVNQAGAHYAGDRLVPRAVSRNTMAMAAGIAAAVAMAAHGAAAPLATVQGAVRTAVFTSLQNYVPANAGFETGGIYGTTRIIDIGTAGAAPQFYVTAVNGRVNINGVPIDAPGVNRQVASIPALGEEVLWDPLLPPDPNAPVAIVISTPDVHTLAPTGTGWQGTNPPVTFQGGTMGNCASIGIVLTFIDFAYFTAGDLPRQGEDPIGDALVTEDLPDGHNNFRANPLPRVQNLHCSHHGSAASTSDAFVQEIVPVTAMISCGHRHQAPAQRVINTLNNNVPGFFLTNCNYPRANVPRSAGANQLTVPGNRAWVSGDNVLPNINPLRVRGDILLHVTQAWAAQGPAGATNYQVTYWENDPPPGGAGPLGARTVTVLW